MGWFQKKNQQSYIESIEMIAMITLKDGYGVLMEAFSIAIFCGHSSAGGDVHLAA